MYYCALGRANCCKCMAGKIPPLLYYGRYIMPLPAMSVNDPLQEAFIGLALKCYFFAVFLVEFFLGSAFGSAAFFVPHLRVAFFTGAGSSETGPSTFSSFF